MKKKRFYNNKKRNEKWTEDVKGRKISFADKYITDGDSKFDKKSAKNKKPVFTKENLRKFSKNAVAVICCLIIVAAGYTLMDVYMLRRAMPENQEISDSGGGIKNVSLEFKSREIDSLSLDGAVMLSAVIDDAVDNGYTSVTFDIKRDDGTIGYDSLLATIDTYGAVSSPASNLEKSVAALLERDVLPIARISCYKDNIIPEADDSAAVKQNGKVYKDADGNTYLNPNSDIAYSYIKGIIEETKGMGITVFILDNCALPEEIKGSYSDGFDILSKRLYSDFGSDIKFISPINADIKSDKAKNIEEEIKEELTDAPGVDETYMITAKSKKTVKKILDGKGISSYIIAE